MMHLLTVIIFCFVIFNVDSAPTKVVSVSGPTTRTTIKTRNATAQGTIDYKIVGKPHHLFIGRCDPDDKILHQENIILYNDGKSHVAAGIRVNIQAEVSISCVNIYDEIPDGAGGYPSFVAGGLDHNFVEFNVVTDYGKGFHFFVQIFGDEIKE